MTRRASMKRVTVACLVALPVFASTVVAQESPYVTVEGRLIKALSAEEVDGYLEGRGMGFALAAELNGYPGPRHVLELADSLGLDAPRRDSVRAVFDRMHAEAVRLGTGIVAAEAALDSAFAQRRIAAHELSDRLARIASLRGELRYVHLAAHLEVTALLSDHERYEYQRLRGYTGNHRMEHGAHQQHR